MAARRSRAGAAHIRKVIGLASENTRLKMALDLAPSPSLNSTLSAEWFKRYERWYAGERSHALRMVGRS